MARHHIARMRLVEFRNDARGRCGNATDSIGAGEHQDIWGRNTNEFTTEGGDIDEGRTVMRNGTLVDLLENNRSVERAVCYVEGENAERRLPYGEVHARALGILHHLQAMGAQRGDKVIIFLNNNEQFLDAFWAAVCGGIIPVPLSVGLKAEAGKVEQPSGRRPLHGMAAQTAIMNAAQLLIDEVACPEDA
jgi:hypothetical protein